MNRPVVLQIQRELVDERKAVTDTAAGKAVIQTLDEQIRQHQAELERVEEEMKQAVEDDDEETREELEEEMERLRERMEKVKKDLGGMAADYAAEKEKMEARM